MFFYLGLDWVFDQLAAMKAGSKDLKVTMKNLKIDEVDVSIECLVFPQGFSC